MILLGGSLFLIAFTAQKMIEVGHAQQKKQAMISIDRLHKCYSQKTHIPFLLNLIRGVMVSVFALSAVDHEFEPRSGQTKDYKTGICCFSAKNTALRTKSKGLLAWNLVNVSEWEGHVYPQTVLSVC